MLSIPSVEPLTASKLRVEPSSSPKAIPDASTLVFGQTFTDHMLTCKWNIERGWDAPVISEYKNLEISPAATVLHYAPTLFEGLKVRNRRPTSLFQSGTEPTSVLCRRTRTSKGARAFSAPI